MHLIERIFHVAPDGGSGVLELELELLLAFLLFVLTFVVIRKTRTKH
jgi:hypothetical protein